MNLMEKDRIGQYLIPHLDEMIFDELSEAYLKKAGVEDILSEVPVPIRKKEMNNISVLAIARNMAFVIGCDPSFKYKENYVKYILRNFNSEFSDGLVADGVDGAQKKDFDYACIQFRAAVQVNPDNANAYYCYGRACKDAYELGEEEEFVGRFKAEALEAFEVATVKNPKLAEAFYFLGYAYLNMGLYIKAKLTWEAYLKLLDESGSVSSLTGEALEELEATKKEVEERLFQLREPIKIEEGYNMILSNRFEEGIEALSPYKEGQFAQWWPLWYYLGTAYVGLENHEEAVSCFKEVLKYSPSNEEAMSQLVELYDILKDPENQEKYEKKLEIVRANAEEDAKLKETMAQAPAELMN